MSDDVKNSLEDVLIDVVMQNADRAALVRPAQEGKPAAVCVIMIGPDAIAEIGSELRKLFAELGSTPGAEFAQPFTETTGLNALFTIADTAPRGWSYGIVRLGRQEAMVALVAREVERVAAICNAHGAPCSLQAHAAAPGWNIERTIKR